MGRIIPYIMENKKCLKPPTSYVTTFEGINLNLPQEPDLAAKWRKMPVTKFSAVSLFGLRQSYEHLVMRCQERALNRFVWPPKSIPHRRKNVTGVFTYYTYTICIVLYYIVLYHIILCVIVQKMTIIWQYTVLYYIILYHGDLSYLMLSHRGLSYIPFCHVVSYTYSFSTYLFAIIHSNCTSLFYIENITALNDTIYRICLYIYNIYIYLHPYIYSKR